MIIFRYLSREILSSTFAICIVLLLVLISGRFVKYLGNALAGNLDPSVIFAIIGYRIPGFLELTIPLGFFLAILLVFGRLHVESEMSVLRSSGISERQLLSYVLSIAFILSAVVAWLSLSVSPAGAAKAEMILKAQEEMTELDKVSPKRFYRLSGSKGVTYAESIGENRELDEVFVAMTAGSDETYDNRLVVVVAEKGRQEKSMDGEQRFLVLERGYRIEGVPGSYNYQITHFDQYGSKLKSPKKISQDPETDAITSLELWDSDDLAYMATLQWRLSAPLMVVIIVLLAVPLSRTNPRKGRFAKLLPAVLLYFFYLMALNIVRENMETGEIPIGLTLLPVHGFFLCLGCFLIWIEEIIVLSNKLLKKG